MSKYEKLWQRIRENGAERICLSFDEIGDAAGVPIDHSFLTVKKELPAYGYRVGKISLKARTVVFEKLKGAENELSAE